MSGHIEEIAALCYAKMLHPGDSKKRLARKAQEAVDAAIVLDVHLHARRAELEALYQKRYEEGRVLEDARHEAKRRAEIEAGP